MDEYENDRWRIISGKVGNGFSAAACKEKAVDLAQPELAEPPTIPEEQTHDALIKHDARAAASAALPALRTKRTRGIVDVVNEVSRTEGS